MLVSVESTDKIDISALSVDCTEDEFKDFRAVTVPGSTQKNNICATENSATTARAARIRSMVCDRQEM